MFPNVGDVSEGSFAYEMPHWLLKGSIIHADRNTGSELASTCFAEKVIIISVLLHADSFGLCVTVVSILCCLKKCHCKPF